MMVRHDAQLAKEKVTELEDVMKMMQSNSPWWSTMCLWDTS